MTTYTPQTRADRSSARHGAARAIAMTVVGGSVALAACGSAAPSGGEPITPLSSLPESSVAVDVAVDSLAAGLLDAAVLGVPPDWAVRDIESGAVADPGLAADTDPFLGLLQCPDGTIREGIDRVWVERKYTAPEVPLENGLLSIEIIVEVESTAQWEHDRDALDDCTTFEQSEVEVARTSLVVPGWGAPASSTAPGDGDELEAASLQLLASPTADVPYPSAFNATITNVDGRTVTVVLGGIDTGQSWQAVADDLALTVIDTLRSQ